ncbi:glycosyltransferase family 2 protein [Nocardioides sp. LHG3406-4]|uniref:glycosyltransferase family 2 protein n=1 Tax=Nocardioides sp. LHG3406-4 TaxID=2804575 RepID=UPI003CEED284
MRFHRPRALTTRPTVSVVVPCYNYGHYLPDAVASALDQEGLEVDVLIVDDASPDDSARVARKLAAADPRVDVLVHDVNAGHIRTYNDGLTKATGDYVVLLSADDQLPRNALTRAVALMEHHPRVGLVYGHPATFETTPTPSQEEPRNWTVWSGREWLGALVRRGGNVIMSPEVVLRREAWQQIGEYDARLPHSADLAAWLHTALRWDIGRVNGTDQAYYRVHGANMHLTTYAGMLVDLTERRTTFELLMAEGDPLPADARQLHARARAALASQARRLAREAAESPADRAAFLAFADETAGPLARRPRPSSSPVVLGGAIRSGRAARRRVRETMRYHRWHRYGL